jgi:hypothetical protein
MPKGYPKQPRADKGTRRSGDEPDRFYSFRLNPNDINELPVIEALEGWLAENDKKSMRDLVKLLVKDRLPNALTKEEQLAETFEQQIERLAASIDRLMSLKLERVSGGQADQSNSEDDVDMNYLKRIQQSLRGSKK